MAKPADLLRLGRIQTAGVTCLTATIGCILAGGWKGLPDYSLVTFLFEGTSAQPAGPWLHLLLLTFLGILIHLFGFALNEYVDYDLDRRSKHLKGKPLVSGAVKLQEAKTFIMVTGALMIFLGLTICLFDIQASIIFLVSVAFGVMYNVKGKRIVGSDFLLATWAGLFCLYGGMTMTVEGGGIESINPIRWIEWIGEGVLSPPWEVHVAALLAFGQVAFNNSVEGGMKDATTDRKSGAKTIAVFTGVQWNKDELELPIPFTAYAIALKGAAILLVVVVLFLEWPGIIIGVLTILMLVLIAGTFGVFMFHRPEGGRKSLLKVFSMHEIFTFWLPVALFAVVMGWFLAPVVALLPVVWYIAANQLLYGSAMAPRV